VAAPTKGVSSPSVEVDEVQAITQEWRSGMDQAFAEQIAKLDDNELYQRIINNPTQYTNWLLRLTSLVKQKPGEAA